MLRQGNTVVDRNVYWLSTQPDVIDWNSTEGNPQANNGDPLSQYADLTGLQTLPSEAVQVAAATKRASGGDLTTTVTVTNPSSNSAVAFFLRADVRKGNPDGTAKAGDNQVLPITWSDNDITLWPGESQTLTATYHSSLLGGATPVVSVAGWNVPNQVAVAAQSHAAQSAVAAAARAHAPCSISGSPMELPATREAPKPGHGAAPGSAIAPAKAGVTARACGSATPRRPRTPAVAARPGRSRRWPVRPARRRRPASLRATTPIPTRSR